MAARPDQGCAPLTLVVLKDATMMKHIALVLAFLIVAGSVVRGQGLPWEQPLMIASSTDGVTFDTPTIFQDSAGVPSVIRWKGDTLVAAFQWFRQPNPSPSWDRVAVKFSYDSGTSWTDPTPIVVNGLPPGYQRPFDPALALLGGDSLRIYFSSSDGPPMGGLDSTVNTYSAAGTDGIHFTFEPEPRVDEINNRVIDPSVIFFGPGWHYVSPIGAPQEGAYHYLSPNGIDFTQVPAIPSDMQHNWTGNYMVDSPTELRFYGCGGTIWYNSSPNGGLWNGYVNTNLHGGDPSVVHVGEGNYLIVFVGQPINTVIEGPRSIAEGPLVQPIPASDVLRITWPGERSTAYRILSSTGDLVLHGGVMDATIETRMLRAGVYVLELVAKSGRTWRVRFVKE